MSDEPGQETVESPKTRRGKDRLTHGQKITMMDLEHAIPTISSDLLWAAMGFHSTLDSCPRHARF
jgi:hypothetical protein